MFGIRDLLIQLNDFHASHQSPFYGWYALSACLKRYAAVERVCCISPKRVVGKASAKPGRESFLLGA